MADEVMKQLFAVVDERTTVLCLSCTGQVRRINEPFDTLAGPIDEPPFHWHCRSLSVPWLPGMGDDLGVAARSELRNRSEKELSAPPPGRPSSIAAAVERVPQGVLRNVASRIRAWFERSKT